MIQLLIISLFAVCGTLFVFGERRVRTLLALVSIFIAAFELEIGIGLNLPSLLAILSGILLVTGQIEIAPRCARLFGGRLLLFFLWGLGVWLVGYASLDATSDAQYGWTRSATVKPIIQFVRCLLFVPFALVVADGLRLRRDVHWFLNRWAHIALLSALLCIAQVGAHKVAGKTIGIYNAHKNEFRTATVKVAGTQMLRASGLSGEPKSQGMALAVSLCMLIATWDGKLIRMSRASHRAHIVTVAVAMLLTFSSGALVMLPILVVLIVFHGRARTARQIAVACVLIAAAAAFLLPQLAKGIWDARLQKVVDLTGDLHGEGWGMDKERPAMIYLLQNPAAAVTGVGVGIGPYHFDKLIPLAAFRGKYVDPNSGVLWGLYGFGVVGLLLFLAGLWPELSGSKLRPEMRFTMSLILRFVLMYFSCLYGAVVADDRHRTFLFARRAAVGADAARSPAIALM